MLGATSRPDPASPTHPDRAVVPRRPPQVPVEERVVGALTGLGFAAEAKVCLP